MSPKPGWLRVDDPGWLRFGPWASALFIVVGCALISSWHLQFAAHSTELDPAHSKSPGVHGSFEVQYQVFFYFLYYTGKFPIYFTGDRAMLTDHPEVAKAHLTPRKTRSELANEKATAIRKGDWGQILLLYPDVWMGEKPLEATGRAANLSLALGSMLALFISLSLLQHRLLGVLLVALLGSHPFAVYHLYHETNVWAFPIVAGSLCLALSAPLIFSPRPRLFHWALPLVAGIMLACFREVRTEPAVLGVSVAIACALAPGGWWRRAALVALLAGGFLATSSTWSHFWEAKLEEARVIVQRAKGRPLGSLVNYHHSIWHPVWCGLGDFGAGKGYKWSDLAAFSYAIPLVNERYGLDLKRLPRAFFLTTRDEWGNHLRPETLPEYTTVLREKVIEDVTGDPVWYLDILRQRFLRIMNETTPVRIGWGAGYIDIPFTGWLALPMLALTLLWRRWDQAKLLIFFCPTSATAFLIYSGWGFTHPTAFHVVAFATLTCWVVHLVTNVTTREEPVESMEPGASAA